MTSEIRAQYGDFARNTATGRELFNGNKPMKIQQTTIDLLNKLNHCKTEVDRLKILQAILDESAEYKACFDKWHSRLTKQLAQLEIA